MDLLAIGITLLAKDADIAIDAVKLLIIVLLIKPLPDTLIDPVIFKLLLKKVLPVDWL